jgi:hypothetical protein
MIGLKIMTGRSLVEWVDGLGKRFRRQSEVASRKLTEKSANGWVPRTEAERSLAAAMGVEDAWADEVGEALDGR